MHDDLIEIGQHVIDRCKGRHLHLKTERLGHVDNRNVDLIRTPQEGTFVSFILLSQRTQD